MCLFSPDYADKLAENLHERIKIMLMAPFQNQKGTDTMPKTVKTDTENTAEAANNTTIWQAAVEELQKFTGDGQIAAIHKAEKHLSKLISTNYKSALAGFSSLKQQYEKAIEDQSTIRSELAKSLKSLGASLLDDTNEMKALVDRIVGQASVEKKKEKDPKDVLQNILKEFDGTESVQLRTINQIYKARTGNSLPTLPKLQKAKLAPTGEASLKRKPVWKTKEVAPKGGGAKYTVKDIDKKTKKPIQAKDKYGNLLFTNTVNAIKTKDWIEFLG